MATPKTEVGGKKSEVGSRRNRHSRFQIKVSKILEELPENEAAELVRISKRLRAKRKQSNAPWPGTSLLRLAGSFEGPEDLSERHDYYLTREH